jgi:hypothetical protein
VDDRQPTYITNLKEKNIGSHQPFLAIFSEFANFFFKMAKRMFFWFSSRQISTFKFFLKKIS